jgi:hypothetical protein
MEGTRERKESEEGSVKCVDVAAADGERWVRRTVGRRVGAVTRCGGRCGGPSMVGAVAVNGRCDTLVGVQVASGLFSARTTHHTPHTTHHTQHDTRQFHCVTADHQQYFPWRRTISKAATATTRLTRTVSLARHATAIAIVYEQHTDVRSGACNSAELPPLLALCSRLQDQESVHWPLAFDSGTANTDLQCRLLLAAVVLTSRSRSMRRFLSDHPSCSANHLCCHFIWILCLSDANTATVAAQDAPRLSICQLQLSDCSSSSRCLPVRFSSLVSSCSLECAG